MQNDIRQVEVVLFSKGLMTLSYIWNMPKEPVAGTVVKVPFRNSLKLGLVLREAQSDVPLAKMKPVAEIVPLLSYPDNFVKFLTRVASYNCQNLSSIFNLSIPTNVVESILKDKLKEKESEQVYNIKLPELNSDQESIYLQIDEILKQKQFSVEVIHGVTGSGKTEIYFHHIKDIIENGGQVLYLLPEISLSTQLTTRFRERFGREPAMWHSQITAAKKKNLWQDIVTGKEQVVIGARSALFLPFKDLRLIIVDEEHDGSFKQEEQVIYNARDMAVLRGYSENTNIILGSATPSIETMHNVSIGKYNYHMIESRHGEAFMPEIRIVDTKSKSKSQNYISKELQQEVEKCLEDGMQSILFLNRKGYAPLTMCKSCGERYVCPNCSSWLVMHKREKKYCCHHCGIKEPMNGVCKFCNEAESLISIGPGVERIAEEAKKLFPKARIAVYTRDDLSKLEELDSLNTQIMNGEIDIIIGTQLITKGYHFPKIKLVGIIDADLGIFGADLRAAEKTFQVITQVAGRSGREGDKGKVIIQTLDPKNNLLNIIANQNFNEFVNLELEVRKDNKLPPFSHIASLILTGADEDNVVKAAHIMAREFDSIQDIQVIGPMPCIIYKLRSQYRYQIIFKSESKNLLQKIFSKKMLDIKLNSNIRVKVDIDPYNFT